MPNVPQRPDRLPPDDGPGNSGNELPHDGSIDARLSGVESDLTAIKIDIAVIKAIAASKADLAEAKVTIIFWLATIVILGQVLPSVLKLFVH